MVEIRSLIHTKLVNSFYLITNFSFLDLYNLKRVRSTLTGSLK